MKVLLLTTSFPLHKESAAGIFVKEGARYLVKQGVDVTVLAPHHPGALKRECVDGINVFRFQYMWPAKLQTLCYGAGLPTNLKRSWLARFQLIPFLFILFFHTLIRSRGADIIQCNWSIPGLIGVITRIFLWKPVVLIMYGSEVFVFGNVWWYRMALRFILKHTHYLICISSYTLEKTLAVFSASPVKIIPPGVDLERFKPERKIDDFRTAVGLEQDSILLFSLGNFIERKGFTYLIDAMDILVNKKGIGNVQLMMGGKGVLREELMKKVQDLGLSSSVVFLDFIPDEDMPSYHTEADIFILPSIIDARGDTEGLGMVMVEANACGTPCVASRVGGIVDVIEHEVNGLLSEQKDPENLAENIEILLKDREKREQMGKNGQRIVSEKFDWHVNAGKIKDVYSELIGQ
jgi:glycosyltransferase involved in cell wall biosynthesis